MNGTTVKVYSKAKDGELKLSENFKVKEFACKDRSDPIFISPELVEILQAIRDHFGKAVTITSAYRTPTHNKKENGATHSQHLYGMAADIKIKGINPKAIAEYAEKLLVHGGGIGVYSTFVHIDVRKCSSKWENQQSA